MVVGALKISFYLRGNRSLKGKRHVLKKIKDRVRSKFNVSIAEVEANDSWERFYLGISVAGSDRRHVNSVIDNVRAEIDDLCPGDMLDSEFEIINLM